MYMYMYTYVYNNSCIAGSFVGLNFRYQALNAYFRGLIFIVYPEHVIIVAYYPRLYSNVTNFRGVDFPF